MTRHVKGTHVINIVNYVNEKKGKAGLERLWERMEEEHGEGFRKEYSESEWVDYDIVIEFFEAIEELFGDDFPEMPRSRDIGRHIAENLGHLDYLARAEGLKEMVEKAQQGWRQVYDFGELELAEWGEDRAVLRYHDFPENEYVCNYFQGSLEKDLELLNLDGNVEHTACPLEGADYMEFTLTW